MGPEFKPKLIIGIGRWELFPGMFIIGNVELDRYMRVPAESIEPVWRAIQYYDGSRSFSEISELIRACGWRFDVAELYRKLAEAGLVAGSSYISDLNRLSVTWLEVRISRLFPSWRSWSLFSHLLSAAMILSVMVAGVVWLAAPVVVSGTWNPSDAELAVAMLAGVSVSILVHEVGHALAAWAEGLTPDLVRLLGYLGVIPYIILRIPGLYTICPAGRLRVWLAGPLASMSLASVCYLASSNQMFPLFVRVWLDHMVAANLMLAIVNCCPLLPTDGYFVVATLLRQSNWRIRSWRELSNCIRERRRPQVLLFLYALGSSILLGFMTLHFITRILKVTSFSWFGYAAVLLLILLFGFKRLALKRRRVAVT